MSLRLTTTGLAILVASTLHISGANPDRMPGRFGASVDSNELQDADAAKDKTNRQAPEDSGKKGDASAKATAGVEQPQGYVVGVEDELQISVWHEPELSAVVAVRPDGMITLPLLNDVKAAGLKTQELQKLLEEKFKGFVNEPQVTVIVRAIHSRKVYLVGQVAKQGNYPLNGDMTVLQLLAEAGGLGTFAKADSIYILREQNGKKVRIPFSYKKAVAGKSENIELQPGDMVIVP